MNQKNDNSKDLPIIGSKTLVDFLDYGIESVPAKVDTGAYTSSVWATQITETNGILSFVLFSPSSPWYTGEKIETSEFTFRKVKNSFGDSETRYQVSLRIRLESKVIKINTTLANRENNRYPILVGLRTLKGKFLVDVRQEPKQNTGMKKKMLVLVRSGRDKVRDGLGKIQKEIDTKIDMDIVRYDDLEIAITESGVSIKAGNKDLNNYQLVYFFTRVRNEQLAAIVAAQARKLGIVYIDKAAEKLYSNGKLHQYATLSGRGVKIPETIFVNIERWEDEFDELEARLGLPFIFKDNAGRKGRNNHLVKTKKQFLEIIKQAKAENRQMLAQKFIPNHGYYRLLALGSRVPFVSYRAVDQAKGHIFKKEFGKPAELIKPEDLPNEVLSTALLASSTLEIDLAGVDMLQDEETGMWYCLEVNSSPQLVDGSFVDEKLEAVAKFFLEEAQR